MTTEMRERAISAIETSIGTFTIESARKSIAQKERELNYWTGKGVWEEDYKISMLQDDIEYFQAIIEVLTEQMKTAELEAATGTIQSATSFEKVVSKITTIRKAVATMANQLHKLGYSLSNVFKTAWRRVKESMTCKVSGVTYENRQQLLKFIAGQSKDDLTVYLKRDRANLYDRYAVAVVVEIKNIGYAHIGYLAKGLSQSFCKVIDNNIPLKADVQVTGGYGYKENYGALLNITI